MQSEVRNSVSTAGLTGSRRVGSFHLPAIVAFLILLFGTVGMVVAQSSGGSTSGSSSGSGTSGTSGSTGSTGAGSAGASGTSSTGSNGISTATFAPVQSALHFQGKLEANGVYKVEFSRQDGPFKEQGFNRQPEYLADGYLAFYVPGTFSGSTGASGANGAGAGNGTSSGTTGSAGSTSGSAGSANGSTAGALDNVFVAGEIPLRENEVANFEQALERANIWIPAIHNHEIQETPRLIFVHVETVGSAHQIATAIRQAMDQTRGRFKEDQAREVSATKISGLANIQSTIGYNAKLEEGDGVLTVIVPRQENFSDCAVAITQQNNGTSGAGAGASGSSSSNGNSGSSTSSTGTSGSASSGTSGSGTSTSGTASTGAGANGSASGNSGASAVGMSSNAGMAMNNCLLASLQAQPGMTNGTAGNSGSGTSNTSGTGSTSSGSTDTASSGTAGASTSASGNGANGTASASMNLIPPEVGAVNEFHFEMGGNGSVDASVELALLPVEVPQTVRLLRENGFVISAIHNHFAFESPRLLFLHASGQGSATKLAQVLRMALDQNAALSGNGANGANGTSGSGTGTSSSGSSSSGPAL